MIATVMAGGIARAQTMGEYANTTAMSTANKPAAPEVDPAMGEHRTWETNPWGGRWKDRVGGAGGSFSERAAVDKEKDSEKRWPGTGLRDDAGGGDDQRFKTGERFAAGDDDKRFKSETGERFKEDDHRFPEARFHEDMGLDEHYDHINTQHYDSATSNDD
jgi:hypothetical protein